MDKQERGGVQGDGKGSEGVENGGVWLGALTVSKANAPVAQKLIMKNLICNVCRTMAVRNSRHSAQCDRQNEPALNMLEFD